MIKKTVKNVVKVLFGIGTLAAMATVVAGCSESPKHINETENRLTSSLKEVLKTKENKNLEKFEILAVDVEKTGFTFDVIFNGVAGFENEEKAYLSTSYKVGSDAFVDLKKNSSREEVFEVFSNIVNTHEIEDYSITPVANFKNINEALVKNTPSPFNGYKINQGLVYNIGMPTFNDETKEISFDIKTLVKLKQGRVELGFGLGFGFNGSVGLGGGLFPTSKISTIILADKYTIDAKELDFEALKKNPEKVFDYFVDAIKEKDGSKIKAEREYANNVTYKYANDLSIDLKNVDKEMGE